MIRKVFAERMKPLHPAIRVLQSGDPRLMDKFDDLYKNFWPGTERTEVDGIRNVEAINDIEKGALSAPLTEEQEQSSDSRPSGRSRNRADRQAPGLSVSKIRELVMAGTITDLVALLDRP